MTTPHEKALEAAQEVVDHTQSRVQMFEFETHVLFTAAYLTALSEQGYVVVPVEPTDEMWTAGHQAWSRMRVTAASLIYKAMINAAPKVTE